MTSWIFCADKSVRASMTYDASVTFVETKIYGKSSRELKRYMRAATAPWS